MRYKVKQKRRSFVFLLRFEDFKLDNFNSLLYNKMYKNERYSNR